MSQNAPVDSTNTTTTPSHEDHPVAQGVDELISRLRQEGVDAGNTEAEQIIANAKLKAKSILQDAEVDAKVRLQKAKDEADNLILGGNEALKTAMRDMILSLKTSLTDGFTADVKRLIKKDLTDPDLLKQLIIELAGKMRSAAELDASDKIEFLLPESVPGLNELQHAPEQLEDSPLTALVFGLTREMLVNGVTFKGADSLGAGMKVQLKDKDVIVDLSEEAVAEMLLAHLQPRFRAILEGVVR